jgi:glycosyltransferase involved in cell wall biosynthesis
MYIKPLLHMHKWNEKERRSIMEDRLRIYIVAALFAPSVGGAQARAEKQARQLQALGHDVTIVTLHHERRWKREEILDGLPIVRVGGIYNRQGTLRIGRLGHLPVDILIFLTLWRLRHRYDVIHVSQFGPLAAVSALLGKITHKPVIVSVPTTGPRVKSQEALLLADTLSLDTNFLRVDFKEVVAGDISYVGLTAFGGDVMLNFLRRSDAFYQILSRASYSYLISHGFRAGRIVYIPNGVDTEKFRPVLERRSDPAQPERNIVCVARLQYAKGIDVLLHAWGRMMHAPSEWRTHLRPKLLLVGEGTLRPQLERITDELGIRDSVEFMGLRRDVISLLQQAWGFVLPSRWEGMPNALLEAMACGLPCVATRVSGSEDIIAQGVNGLLVEPEQPAELAQALRHIIEDSDFAQRLAQEARATVLSDYQLTRIVDRCVEVYRSIQVKDTKNLPLAVEGVGR